MTKFHCQKLQGSPIWHHSPTIPNQFATQMIWKFVSWKHFLPLNGNFPLSTHELMSLKGKLENVISFAFFVAPESKRRKLFPSEKCHLSDEARCSHTHIFMIGRQHVPHWCDNLWDFAERGIGILSFNRCLSVSEEQSVSWDGPAKRRWQKFINFQNNLPVLFIIITKASWQSQRQQHNNKTRWEQNRNCNWQNYFPICIPLMSQN